MLFFYELVSCTPHLPSHFVSIIIVVMVYLLLGVLLSPARFEVVSAFKVLCAGLLRLMC
jgi:hypothetical protein